MSVTTSTVAISQPPSNSPDRAVPEPGQVVDVRGSTWAVAQVQEQALPRSPADEAVPGLSHAVTLQALDEDRLGEELTVIWELEVGHTVTPAQGLPTQINPDAFDDPIRSPGSSTQCGGEQSPRPTTVASRHHSTAASPSRHTNWSRCAGHCHRRGRTYCSPTTSAPARPSRRDLWCRSCCYATGHGPRSWCARRVWR
jgi:hypothetical protein